MGLVRNTKSGQIKSILLLFLSFLELSHCQGVRYCSGFDKHETNSIYGNALVDSYDCINRDGKAYPIAQLRRMLPQLKSMYRESHREGKQLFSREVQSPEQTRLELLKFHQLASHGSVDEITKLLRKKRQVTEIVATEGGSAAADATEDDEEVAVNATRPQTCMPDNEITPARLCKTTFNTTAPMYGVSLTSGKPVTIVQIFPDLLQQVIFEKCDSKECDVVHGECVQTYVPYLFLVIPLGPVTLTGQDYVLIESGCSCRPKYSRPGSEPNPASILPEF